MDFKKINLIIKILSCKEIKTITTDCEENTQLIPFFSFPKIDEFLSNYSKFSSISQQKIDSNSKNNIDFDFTPNNQVLIRIYQNSNWDNDNISSSTYQLQVLYSKYCLFSFVKFFINEDPLLKSQFFIQLIKSFTKLKKIKNKNIQSLINESFSYLWLTCCEFVYCFLICFWSFYILSIKIHLKSFFHHFPTFYLVNHIITQYFHLFQKFCILLFVSTDLI